MENIIKKMNLDTYLSLEEIPDLDLYMDQVIQLFENKYADTKRNEDEKVLTKTMINNYAKGKLFFPIKNKKYSKGHVILISMIYQMKTALSINDVKQTLDKLNNKITEDEFNLQNLYKSYLHLLDSNVNMFTENMEEQVEEIKNEVAMLENKDEEYLQQFLLIAAFTNMSNFYRRAAEKIVDELEQDEKED
ncbi:hypothetical protein CIL03_10550 [Virgibacillus indicus]|uniref:Cytoplasmic protein n=1 Tax=Virgibacillus indicus TaxID=2024554 RepID=A0A265NB85_9BACI|nr:DUF1836 domain-containing protein [Virgibacillus indicus]OZU88719.1 hypothetical protein CIL03_10550 [Virgibacillus indicus]